MLRFWFFCATLLMAGAAMAQVYECVDAKGARGYSNFCPPGTVRQREVMKERSGADEPRGPGREPPKSIEAQDVEFKKRLLERQEAETKAAQAKTQADEAERNCNDARAQLKALGDGQRLSRIDAVTGERTNFGDDEFADEMARMRKAETDWCKG